MTATVVGALLIAIGIVLDPAAIVAALRPAVTDLSTGIGADLLAGAQLFRIGAVLMGIILIAIVRMPTWHVRVEATRAAGNRMAENAALGGILVVALLLRLIALNAGLWLDETLTYVNYLKMPFAEAMTTYDSASKNQHFLFTALAQASFLIFGDSVASLRLPAVLFGVASIWAVYLFGREVGDRREALLTAALMALSYHHVWFSQNARGYTGLLLWTLLSSWYLVRGLREVRPDAWVLYAIAVALGMYTHLTMLFVIAGQCLVYAGAALTRGKQAWPSRWTGLIVGFALGGFLTLFLYSLVLPQLLFGPAAHEPSTVSAWKNPLTSLLELLQGKPAAMVSVAIVGGLSGALVFAVGLLSFARTEPVVVPLTLLPILLTAGAGIAMGHHLWPRYFFSSLGLVALVVMRGMLVAGEYVAGRVNGSAARATLLRFAPAGLLVVVSALSVPLAYGPKQDFGGAFAFVQAERQPDDAIVMTGLVTRPFQRLYGADWTIVNDTETLDSICARARRTWVVYTLPLEMQAVRPALMSNIQRDFTLVRTFDGTLGGGTIFIYRRDSSALHASVSSAVADLGPRRRADRNH